MPPDETRPEVPPAASTKAGFVPGARKARHLRLARMTKWVTAGGLVVVAAIVAWLVFSQEAKRDSTLDRLAEQVTKFRARTGRLPNDLNELFSPDSPSPFDAEPWDRWHRPFEYRVVDREKGTFRLRTTGPDRKPDTADDIVWPPGESWR